MLEGGIGVRERLFQPGGSCRPAQSRHRDHDFPHDARVSPVGEGGQRAGQSGIARPGGQAMLREDRVATVSHGAYGLHLETWVGGQSRQFRQLVDRRRAAKVGQDPRGVQSSPEPEATLADCLADGRKGLVPHPLDADLGIDTLGVALRIEASDLALDAVIRITV